ncbi:sulfatase [Lentisphaera araneosa HTCC2155]|uniref:Sulfatase n=1 Tax=Lentisphaera araneosa HTCC2155 TaxID=313628 RepID=A6DMZ0_9BACT|nr:sulfatase [Lentisphaera araneosa]EDM27026.1 sulfatase [Lentisphaera araneosa HTCC2155]
MNYSKLFIITLLLFTSGLSWANDGKTNVLLITADDLGYEAIGSLTLDADLPDLTPNLDRFAKQGFQFQNAHINTPICQPGRAILTTGKYGINSGMMGFFHMKKRSATVTQTLSNQGYLTGILGKVPHSTPDLAYQWDYTRVINELGMGRSPQRYYQYCKEFFKRSKTENKPFYFMVNSHDPHRPYHNPKKPIKAAEEPSKLFGTDEVIVPKYLPDTPQVRMELSHYYNSVRRLDDTFAKVMQALNESGFAKNTLVLFLSDNGSAFPFAKANTYLASSKTPWLVQWPAGKIKTSYVNKTDFISAIDFFPTVLDALGLDIPKSVDGRSILPLLKGEKQANRSHVYTQVDYLNGGGPATPMRAIQDREFGYIFNPWSRSGANYKNANEGLITKKMKESGDKAQLERLRMHRERVIEEFYDLKADPHCINNLINNPEYKEKINEYRAKLVSWMTEHSDPVLAMYQVKEQPKKMISMLKSEFPSRAELMPEQQRIEQEKQRQQRNKNKKKKK